MKSICHIRFFSRYSILYGYMTCEEIFNKCIEKKIPVCISDIHIMSSILELYLLYQKYKIHEEYNYIINSVTVNIYINNIYGWVSFYFASLNAYKKFIKIYNNLVINSNDDDLLTLVINIDDIPLIDDCFILVGNKGSILDKAFNISKEQEIFNILRDKYKENIYFCYSNIINKHEVRLKSFLLNQKDSKRNIIIGYPVVHRDNNFELHFIMFIIHKIQSKKSSETIRDVKDKVIEEDEFLDSNYRLYESSELEEIYKNELDIYISNTQDFHKYFMINKFCIINEIHSKDLIFHYDNSYHNVMKNLIKNFNKKFYTFSIYKKSVYYERMLIELSMYNKFNLYSLIDITSEIINWAIENNISIGYGRGSCVGSLIIYLMNITKVDPIEHELIFERFLNEDRFSVPDIDIDICNTKRSILISHIKTKYNTSGSNKYTSVMNIVTFLTMAFKSSVKDTIRVLDSSILNFQEINKILSKIENKEEMDNIIKNLNICLEKDISFRRLRNITECRIELINFCKLFRRRFNIDKYLNDIYQLDSIEEIEKKYNLIRLVIKQKIENITFASKVGVNLENSIKSIGIHAAGFLIPNFNIIDYMPILFGYSDSQKVYATHFDMDIITKIGFMKFDFLGLETLTFIDNIIKKVKKFNLEDINITYINQIFIVEIENIIINISFPIYIDLRLQILLVCLMILYYISFDVYRNIDINFIIRNQEKYHHIFDIYNNGHTRGIFQFEKPKVALMCNRIKVDNFNDIVSINSLNRPGVGDVFEEFVKNKHNINEWEKENKDHPLYEIKKSTYGVLIFQEQIMQTAIKIAGFSKKEADILRYAIGKKDAEKMSMMKNKFVDGARKLKLIEEYEIDPLFSKLEAFAKYSFNKSHAISYSFISLKSAVLKVLYKCHFYTQLFNSVIKNNDKMIPYLVEGVNYFSLSYKKIVIILPSRIEYINNSFTHVEFNRSIIFNSPICILKGVSEEVNINMYNSRKEDNYSINNAILDSFNITSKTLSSLIDSYVFRNIYIKDKDSVVKAFKLISLIKKKGLKSIDNLNIFSIKKEKSLDLDLSKIIEEEILYTGFSLTIINIYSLFLNSIICSHNDINKYNIYIVYDKFNFSFQLSEINNIYKYRYLSEKMLPKTIMIGSIIYIPEDTEYKIIDITDMFIKNDSIKLSSKFELEQYKNIDINNNIFSLKKIKLSYLINMIYNNNCDVKYI